MKSYAVREFGAALAAIEAPTPVPSGTEVLIEVRHCGVCHTDVHLREGWFDLGNGKRLASKLALPHVLGHEIEGEVVACGPSGGRGRDRRALCRVPMDRLRPLQRMPARRGERLSR